MLDQDITVPGSVQYSFVSGIFAKEITIDTAGHTIYVEGCLDLWPYLTIVGDGSISELLHVCSGGELRMTRITVDA